MSKRKAGSRAPQFTPPAPLAPEPVDVAHALEEPVTAAPAASAEPLEPVKVEAPKVDPPPPPKPTGFNPPRHYTRCSVFASGSVIARGFDLTGKPVRVWFGGTEGWFQDADVLSLPDHLLPLE